MPQDSDPTARQAMPEFGGGPPLSHFEFWPAWLFYAPVWLWIVGLMVRYRSIRLPLIANVGFPVGGLVGERKSELFARLTGPERAHLPGYVVVTRTPESGDAALPRIAAQLAAARLAYPLVAKPDIGCRGAGVQPIRTSFDLVRYFRDFPEGEQFLLQRMVDVEGEAGYTTLERTGVRPSLDVNGIWGGYIEEGTKTVIPSKASAKISMRLVPNQDYRKISKLFEKYFKSIAPKSVKVTVKSLHGGMPYVAPTDMPAYKAAQKAIAETFGKKPLPFYSGGSIPIISGFESILGIKSLLIGFGLAEDAIHSPNESYGLEQFDRGVETIPLFYKYFAAEK